MSCFTDDMFCLLVSQQLWGDLPFASLWAAADLLSFPENVVVWAADIIPAIPDVASIICLANRLDLNNLNTAQNEYAFV